MCYENPLLYRFTISYKQIINLVSSSSGNLAASYTSPTSSGNATSPTSPFRTYGGNNATSGGSNGGSGRTTRLEFYIALALAALGQQKEREYQGRSYSALIATRQSSNQPI